MATLRLARADRLRDQIYDLVSEEIQNGRLSAERRLYETDLARRLSVSRTPVREALFQLARDGLIVRGGRGYSLPVNSARLIADRLEVHLILDPAVAAHAARDASGAQLKDMRTALARQELAVAKADHRRFAEATHRFRVTMREACQNEPLRNCAMLLEHQFLAARNQLFRDPDIRRAEVRHNALILLALEARDAERSSQAVRAHMQEARSIVLRPVLEGSLKATSQTRVLSGKRSGGPE